MSMDVCNGKVLPGRAQTAAAGRPRGYRWLASRVFPWAPSSAILQTETKKNKKKIQKKKMNLFIFKRHDQSPPALHNNPPQKNVSALIIITI